MNVLLIGAGYGGRLILDELRNKKYLKKDPIGFLDDDPKLHNKKVDNLEVLGKIGDLPKIVRDNDVKEVIIGICSASGTLIKKITQMCGKLEVELKILPGVYDLLEQDIRQLPLREVNVYDLLKRDSVPYDSNLLKKYLSQKTILVTGGGGSIGSEICRQISLFNPKIIVLDKSEEGLFFLDEELKYKFNNLNIIVGDIRNKIKLDRIFERFKPDIVFHSAAYKHVPLMEYNPGEAVENNIFGSLNVFEMCEKHGVKECVLISTDKAVNPSNIMGATKRICELLLIGFSQKNTNTKFVGVRFGNVLDSSGSVVPLFKKQIKEGGPITLTHPDVTRYFMTVSEACQLVIQASDMAKGGEIYVLDMGKPIKIKELAEETIKLSGLVPYSDIDIKIIGLRAGEKIHEELLTKRENVSATYHERIFIAKPDTVNLRKIIEQINELIKLDDFKKIREKMLEIIPECNAKK